MEKLSTAKRAYQCSKHKVVGTAGELGVNDKNKIAKSQSVSSQMSKFWRSKLGREQFTYAQRLNLRSTREKIKYQELTTELEKLVTDVKTTA